MVRAVPLSLILATCIAEDAYYHTQLLQTKVNSHKVSVDHSGEALSDETVMFQKAVQMGTRKQAAGESLLKMIRGQFSHGQEPGGKGSGKGGEGSGKGGEGSGKGGEGSGKGGEGPPEGEGGGKGRGKGDELGPEEQGHCKMFYGPDVNLDTCGGCMAEMMEQGEPEMPEVSSPEEMQAAMNAMVRVIADQFDGCMGETNSLTLNCEEAYGPEVGLFDCMMCGMINQCTPDACDAEEHAQCMAEGPMGPPDGMPPPPPEGEARECKLFYGEDVDVDQCHHCEVKCHGEAFKAIEKLSEEEAEAGYLRAFIACHDECMDPWPNLAEEVCKAHYGPDVDLAKCYICGLNERCNLEGECEGDHEKCMQQDLAWRGDLLQTKPSDEVIMMQKIKAKVKHVVKALKAKK